MINPNEQDIGRGVVYQAGHPGAKPEDGTITSFNEHCVFVRYRGDLHSKGTRRSDLRWALGIDLTEQVPSPGEALGRADSVSADAPPPSVKNKRKGQP